MKSLFDKKLAVLFGMLCAIMMIVERSYAITEYRKRVINFVTNPNSRLVYAVELFAVRV